MAHQIETHDKGVVGYCSQEGGTWHQMPQYVEFDNMVPRKDVEDVFDFDLMKVPLYGMDPNNEILSTDSYGVYRPDTNHIVHAGVGERYEVMAHKELTKLSYEGIINELPWVTVESAGTLQNNKTGFINMALKDRQLPGDDSPIQNRVMFVNPIGQGSYHLCAHSVRVVCMNTLRMAQTNANNKQTSMKIPHTVNAVQSLKRATKVMSNALQQSEDAFEVFVELTRMHMTAPKVERYFDILFDMDNATEKQTHTRQNAINLIDHLRVNDRALHSNNRDTAYGWLQGTIEFYDNFSMSGTKLYQSADRRWKGLFGSTDSNKQKAITALLSV